MLEDLNLKTLESVFSWNLKRLRGHRTQFEVSEKAGISLRTYQKYEAGSIPQGPNRASLVKALGVTAETSLFLDPDLAPIPTAEQLVSLISDALEDPATRASIVAAFDAFLSRR